MTRSLVLAACVVAAATQSGCGRSGAAPAAGAPAVGIVATVNGRALTEEDLRLAGRDDKSGREEGAAKDGAPKTDGHAGAARPDPLEGLIRQELVYQKALSLGLDRDPAVRKRLREIDAQADAQRRRELAEAYFRSEVAGKAEVSEERARRFFEEHRGELANELHVLQILKRGEAAATQALVRLEKGEGFEQVAAAELGGHVPAGMTPWDLGYLKWTQMPPAWRGVVDRLKDGEISGLIKGPKDRYWIVKVVERRADPASSFEQVRPALSELLKGELAEERARAVEGELRSAAKIVYSPSAPTP